MTDSAALFDFVHSRRIEFCETDLAGVLHFSNYFRIAEEAEHAWFRSCGLSVIMPWEKGTLSWPRVAASFEYFKSLRFEETIEVGLRIEKLGAKSLVYAATFLRAGEATARGRLAAICCRFEAGEFRSTAIPEEIRRRLERKRGAALPDSEGS